MNSNTSKPKYHYVQCVVSFYTDVPSQSTWDDVKNYVNNEGYEIYQMVSVQKYVVYLLRKEIDYGVKDIT